MIRVVLAGGSGEERRMLAAELRDRLGVSADPADDGFVLADPPADPAAFDAELSRRAAEVDALVNLGGAPDALLDHYGRAVVEAPHAGPDGVLERLREALVAG